VAIGRVVNVRGCPRQGDERARRWTLPDGQPDTSRDTCAAIGERRSRGRAAHHTTRAPYRHRVRAGQGGPVRGAALRAGAGSLGVAAHPGPPVVRCVVPE